MMIDKTKYILKSVANGNQFEDSGWLLDEPNASEASLIRAVYEKKQLEVKGAEFGIYRFADWRIYSRSRGYKKRRAIYSSRRLCFWRKILRVSC